MAGSKKKIYLMVCSQLPTISRSDWLSQVPEISIIADMQEIPIFDGAAADITPQIWMKLAKEIISRLDNAAGFVVLHGIDNLLLSSCALAFMLQNLNKTVIFTSIQTKTDEARKMEFRANLINGCQLTNHNLNEVLLLLGNRLLRPCLTTENPIPDAANVLYTPESNILGRIDFSIRIFDNLLLASKGKPKTYEQLNTNIEVINVGPILDLKTLSRQIISRDGIIINAGHYQELPADLILFLAKIVPDIPIVVWSKKIEQKTLVAKNVLLVDNLHWPTTVAKLMWILAQTKNLKEIKELMIKNIIGELS